MTLLVLTLGKDRNEVVRDRLVELSGSSGRCKEGNITESDLKALTEL